MKKVIFMFIMIFCVITFNISAAYENMWFGAKAIGLGGSFVSVADDGSASLWNPAGLRQLHFPGLYLMYSRPFFSIDDSFSLNNFFLSLFYPYDSMGNFNFTYTHFTVSSLYYEDSYILSYSINISKFWSNAFLDIDSGINMKLYNRGFIPDDRTRNDELFGKGTSTTVFASDIGILVKPFVKGSKNYWSLGIVVYDFNSPDIGLVQKDEIKIKYKFGFSYNIIFPRLLKRTIITPVVQMNIINNFSDMSFGINAEFYKRIISLRCGYAGTGFTGGMGINYRVNNVIVGFDYGYSLTSTLTGGGTSTHLVSLNIKFPTLSIKVKPLTTGKTGKSIILKN